MRYKAHILNAERAKLQDVIPLDTPFTLLVEASRLCNFRCKFCPQFNQEKFKLDKNLISLDDFKIIVEQLREFPRPLKKVYMHVAGESTLNPELPAMIKILSESKRAESIELTSNGSLITEELGKKLIDAGLNHLHISVEAMTAEGYKKVAGVKINFEKFVDNIKKFSANRGKCRLSIKIAESSLRDEKDRGNFLETFSPLCDDIFVENIFPIWHDYELPDFVRTKSESVGQYGTAIRDKKVCPQIFSNLAIKSDGSVSPCSVDWDNKVSLGNFHEKTLREIWNGEELKKLRLEHLTRGHYEIDGCNTCGLPKFSCVDDLDEFAEELTHKL